MRCVECGIPEGIGSGSVWRPNGTITGKYPPFNRGCFFDVDELNNLFESISERIGHDISRIVTAGKQKDAKRYMDSLTDRLGEKRGLTDWIELAAAVAGFARLWGLGDARLLRVDRGVGGEVEVVNPYSIPLFLGDAAGILESLERRRATASWDGGRDRGVLCLEFGEEDPELERRLEADIEAGIEVTEAGDGHLETCSCCGAPLEVSKTFAWDLERATITERATGKRYALTNTNGIVAVIRQLLEELGEGLSETILRIERDYARGVYGQFGEVFSLGDELMLFPVKGWGSVGPVSREKSGVKVVARNAFSDHMIAGRLWGLMEIAEGRRLSYGFAPSRRGVLELCFSHVE